MFALLKALLQTLACLLKSTLNFDDQSGYSNSRWLAVVRPQTAVDLIYRVQWILHIKKLTLPRNIEISRIQVTFNIQVPVFFVLSFGQVSETFKESL